MKNLSSLHPDFGKQETMPAMKVASYRHPYRSIKHLKELYANARDVFLKAKDDEGLIEIMATKAYDQLCVENMGRIWDYARDEFGDRIGYVQMKDKFERGTVKAVVASFELRESEDLTDLVCRIRDLVWAEIEKKLHI